MHELEKYLKNIDSGSGWVHEMNRFYENCVKYGFTEISKSQILEMK